MRRTHVFCFLTQAKTTLALHGFRREHVTYEGRVISNEGGGCLLYPCNLNCTGQFDPLSILQFSESSGRKV